MRAIWITFFVMALSFSINTVNEIDNQYYIDNGRYLLGHQAYKILDDSYLNASVNDTISGYGLNKVPTQTGDSFDVFSGAGIMGGLNMAYDYLIKPNIDFGGTLKRTFFPSMPGTLALAISAFVMVNNLLLVLSLLRGWYISR